jgi:uracil-DNA glycosylase family protein
MKTPESESSSAATLIPPGASLKQLRVIAAGCQACPLWQRGTQTVFGVGPRHAEIMFVGEQPGNDEDLAGHPFVGPAGRFLDDALNEAGIDRTKVYVTNVVKHFKWEPSGKRRIHKKPSAREIAACRPWLDAELSVVKPKVLVLLGASAAQSLLGKEFLVSKRHGEFIQSDISPCVTATVHPASILRAPDADTRREQREQFVRDLKKVAAVIPRLK